MSFPEKKDNLKQESYIYLGPQKTDYNIHPILGLM